jgi:hypothetical protein
MIYQRLAKMFLICSFDLVIPRVRRAYQATTATDESSVFPILDPGFVVWKYNRGNCAQQMGADNNRVLTRGLVRRKASPCSASFASPHIADSILPPQ